MLNDIGLCSRALIKIGARPITSFMDGSAESEIANLLYGPSRDAVLSSYAWSFATKQMVLTRLEAPPVADYNFAYQLPNDFLRSLSAGSGGRGRGLNFRIYRDTLQTNAEEVILTYIYRAAEETCPPYFDTAVIARLSAEFCIPLTENTSRADVIIKLAEQEFARARQIDAQQDTPNKLENFSLVDVRG
ncbi:MAG: hypothetical protein DI586_02500 [Micavibrio aeruginosavorus]|uniref:Uncharacterized protein n=1 Tax=Micavibrio aeruginosavorus TaxID=349221 RepID=A0A2W5FQT7_9BACT|nr:MAG: hypothetical protein DI586_02500 [Micavibrio aeruginosavorus]